VARKFAISQRGSGTVSTSATNACLVAVAIAACGAKSHPEDAHAVASGAAGGDAVAMTADAGSAAPPTGGTGQVTVRVEWKDVPVAARASPTATKCGTPRLPAVAPTVTWGIPELAVLVERSQAPAGEARIVASDCALTPRIAVGSKLVIASAMPAPVTLALVAQGDDLHAPRAGASRAIQLPVAGHEVEVALDPGLYELTNGGESAWIVAKSGAAITDASGQATLDAPVGATGVTAWLPKRGGVGTSRSAGTSATVVAGQTVEVTVDLVPPP
jgi:hypothetical protein